MPANLTPEYLEAERKFRAATTLEEKLAALEEMLATIPKHKGTEKMQADIRRRIAKLRQEAGRRPSTARHKPFYHVEKEGAGQVVLVGPPNSGKSSLLARLTHATPEIAAYPFTTRLPMPGMMEFENVQIQLVDMPPLAPAYTEPWMLALVRNADAALLVFDLADDDVLTRIEETLLLLEQANIHLRSLSLADSSPGPEGGRTSAVKRALVLGTKLDLPGARENVELVREWLGERFRLLPVSAQTGENLEALRREVYALLDIIRVYTKEPGKKPDLTAPFVLKRGSTVADIARAIHRDFVERLKYARIWGVGKFDGQLVHRDHVLQDGDIIELHV
ncbi:MAG: TGS domain-containing protein [Blastocatellia bacterium]|nr:TGS domain-containing protein [Blastocatellia bacterium]MCS7157450.1 TGS domain-containing protein [Blastocatellia bacterium]MCX7752623.1 TGS domain-containing protein [Blastocatellia bacterium]MDW8168354.1 TGS domain-containing protein [Acidobacteriota bacterium]MDW8255550.1 TGS domain-containing protein [Acidobacteriota bacterium]